MNQISTFKAKGEYIIIVSRVLKKGDELKKGSLILGNMDTSELPITCEIVSIGDAVPQEEFKVGDVIPFPTGRCREIPHPLNVRDKINDKFMGTSHLPFEKREESYSAVHYKDILCIYA